MIKTHLIKRKNATPSRMAFFTKPKQLLNQLNQTFKYESVIKKPMKKTLKYYEYNFLFILI